MSGGYIGESPVGESHTGELPATRTSHERVHENMPIFI
jgi:hypothetical protein